ncbi:BRO-N domain-containing protein [Luteibacter sp. NPDC031894]|uniref:BRO-N domain-containing protein n=1 Tax=Luteibacter sp. NPDC031894 TaxID=3390572 RepID=UPI003D012177
MSALIPFQFGVAPIRVVEIDGEPWFVGRDVATALGYADTTNAIKQHCRGVAKHHPILDSLGRTQEARVLNEANVLRLIVNSNLPAAEKFEAWVFEEVLPTIRRTGTYSVGQARLAPVADDFRALHDIAQVAGLTGSAAVIAAANATARRTGENPLALIGMTSIASTIQERLLTATDIASEIGLASAQRANALLEQIGLHTSERSGRGKKSWHPTAAGQPFGRWEDTGKRHNDGTPVHQWKWIESVLDEILRRQPRAA